ARLLLRRGVAEPDLDQKAVELGLRQRERALELDWVLGRQHQEGLREHAGHAIDRDLAFAHGFEQRALRAWCRAVDLVGQQDVGEDWAGLEAECAFVLAIDRYAEHIIWQQIGRTLQPPKG